MFHDSVTYFLCSRIRLSAIPHAASQACHTVCKQLHFIQWKNRTEKGKILVSEPRDLKQLWLMRLFRLPRVTAKSIIEGSLQKM